MARPQDGFTQPLQAKDQQERTDDETKDIDRESRQSRAKGRHNDCQHRQARRHALPGGAPTSCRADSKNNRQRLHRLHDAGKKTPRKSKRSRTIQLPRR